MLKDKIDLAIDEIAGTGAVNNPVEILRKVKRCLMGETEAAGINPQDPTTVPEFLQNDETNNFIEVSRLHLLESLDEIEYITDYYLPLCVQFVQEVRCFSVSFVWLKL